MLGAAGPRTAVRGPAVADISLITFCALGLGHAFYLLKLSHLQEANNVKAGLLQALKRRKKTCDNA